MQEPEGILYVVNQVSLAVLPLILPFFPQKKLRRNYRLGVLGAFLIQSVFAS